MPLMLAAVVALAACVALGCAEADTDAIIEALGLMEAVAVVLAMQIRPDAYMPGPLTAFEMARTLLLKKSPMKTCGGVLLNNKIELGPSIVADVAAPPSPTNDATPTVPANSCNTLDVFGTIITVLSGFETM